MPHRAAAAFFAIAIRCSELNFSARLLPPINPPWRPSSTEARSLTRSGAGSALPVMRSMVSFARCMGSRGIFCFFTPQAWGNALRGSSIVPIQTETLPSVRQPFGRLQSCSTMSYDRSDPVRVNPS